MNRNSHVVRQKREKGDWQKRDRGKSANWSREMLPNRLVLSKFRFPFSISISPCLSLSLYMLVPAPVGFASPHLRLSRDLQLTHSLPASLLSSISPYLAMSLPIFLTYYWISSRPHGLLLSLLRVCCDMAVKRPLTCIPRPSFHTFCASSLHRHIEKRLRCLTQKDSLRVCSHHTHAPSVKVYIIMGARKIGLRLYTAGIEMSSRAECEIIITGAG